MVLDLQVGDCLGFLVSLKRSYGGSVLARGRRGRLVMEVRVGRVEVVPRAYTQGNESLLGKSQNGGELLIYMEMR
jgi:hypothetical protein